MMQSLRRTSALVQKELIHLLRDRRALALIVVTPLLTLFLLAYAMRLNVDHISTAVADLSLDPQSRQFVDALVVSGYFDVVMHVADEAAVIRAIDEGRVRAGVVIPPGSAAGVERGEAQVLMVFDGSDMLTVQSGYSAALSIAQAQAMRLLVQKVERLGATVGKLPITSTVRVLYNPDMKDVNFVVPALAAMLMQFISVSLTALSVVREREVGTMEQILATPARPLEMIVGKLVPNVLVSAAVMAAVVLIGILWFGVPFRGSPWLFAALSLLFIISGLGLGLLVSTVAQTQRQAQQITSVLLMLGMLLSGFIYPRSAMPPFVQTIGGFIPLTYFIRIARGIFCKGIGLEFLWNDVLALAVYGVAVLGLASLTYKRRLD